MLGAAALGTTGSPPNVHGGGQGALTAPCGPGRGSQFLLGGEEEGSRGLSCGQAWLSFFALMF